MLASAPQWIVDAGETFAILGAIGAGVATVITKTPVGRFVGWLWRRIVSEPVSEWGANLIREGVREELGRTNGGSAFGDKIAMYAANQEEMRRSVARLEEQISVIKQGVQEI